MLHQQSEILKSIGSSQDNLYGKLQFDALSLLSETLSRLHYVTISQLQDLNVLFDTIEKLPKGEAFDNLKKELEKVKTSDKEITLNVSKDIEKALQEFLKALERAKKAASEYIQ